MQVIHDVLGGIWECIQASLRVFEDRHPHWRTFSHIPYSETRAQLIPTPAAINQHVIDRHVGAVLIRRKRYINNRVEWTISECRLKQRRHLE